MTAQRTTAAQRRENRREEILQAAQDLFLRKGYSNTSLDDIAARGWDQARRALLLFS